jgi:hypothetical protein
MRYRRFRKLLLLGGGAMLSLSACGGGGGGGGMSFIPSPPVAPAPAPPPPASGLTAIKVFPDVTASTDFAAVGYERSPGPSGGQVADGAFSVAYDAAAGVYNMQLGSISPGRLYLAPNYTPPSNETWLRAVLNNGSVSFGELAVFNPSNLQLPLRYTSLVGYVPSTFPDEPLGWVAFGKATAAGGVPVSGTASYDALVRGSRIDNMGEIHGTAVLSFDFGAGKLSGHLDPLWTDPTGLGFNDTALGRYDFVNTVYSSGSTSFSGQLSHTGVATGSFNGQFTGPSAEELLARWTAPMLDPFTSKEVPLFGVLVGKRQ